MAKIIAFAGYKGGAGKTTALAALACFWSWRGRRVSLLDADENQSLAAHFRIPRGRPIDVRRVNLAAAAEAAQAEALRAEVDIVGLDLPGVRARETVAAMLGADLVVIPATPSEPDAAIACELVAELGDIADQVGRRIEARLLLARTPTRSDKVAAYIDAALEAQAAPRFRARLGDRVAYRAMLAGGGAPVPKDPKAVAELTDLAEEIREILDPRPQLRLVP